MSSRISGAILVLALGATASAETAIYRYTDGDTTAFADRPATGRQEVELPSVNTYSAVESTLPPVDTVRPAEPAAGYQHLRITFPGDGEAIRRNGGNLRMTGQVEPALNAGHRAVLLVDGAVAVAGGARQEADDDSDNRRSLLAFALANVSRGPHAASIAIMDREKNVLIQSAPVSFHLLRAAIRHP
ncbi:MAG: hypothetical protein OXH52_19100 [Gammaproteobacteria bacterium]|nr:hypothetical protein [Gammaproteobacteria bacterium]